jgi:diguanylate cyclase (GGDEF)-like protein
MYMDLDKFKQVNDTLGHDTGDMLLRMVAGRLLATIRQVDTVARLGGDEFGIVLGELSNPLDVSKLASKIIKAVSQPYNIQGDDVSVTVSIGISIYPSHGQNIETLLKQADLAMYEAKRTGNSYCIATKSASDMARLE